MVSISAVRQRGARALGVVTLLLVVSACGSNPSPDEDPNPAGTGGAFPVTIEHKYGTTTIEEPPDRVVTIGLTDQDALLALGVVPVATTKWLVADYPGEIGPWARPLQGDAPPPTVLDDTNGPQYERIVNERPDLIVGLYSGMTKQQYEKLSALAPVLAPPAGHADFGIPWQELTRTVGKALGKSDEAEKLVGDVEERIATVRREHPEFADASGVLATTYDGYFVYGRQDPRSRLLSSLGFTLPAELDQVIGNKFGGNISQERADILDTDVLIWFVGDGGAQLEEDPVYNRLRVAREGRDLRIDEASDYGNAFSFASVLSLPYLLDRLVPQLSAALDGDPATRP